MHNPEILYPMFVLAGWTFLILLYVLISRFRSAGRGEVGAEDFRCGESPKVPQHVLVTNRNYMSLLELPVLFYVVSLLLYVTANPSQWAVCLAWAYVALRLLHSLIHLTYNHVFHRMLAFAAGYPVLIALWVIAYCGLQAQV
jgi:hypothetical protein